MFEVPQNSGRTLGWAVVDFFEFDASALDFLVLADSAGTFFLKLGRGSAVWSAFFCDRRVWNQLSASQKRRKGCTYHLLLCWLSVLFGFEVRISRRVGELVFLGLGTSLDDSRIRRNATHRLRRVNHLYVRAQLVFNIGENIGGSQTGGASTLRGLRILSIRSERKERDEK